MTKADEGGGEGSGTRTREGGESYVTKEAVKEIRITRRRKESVTKDNGAGEREVTEVGQGYENEGEGICDEGGGEGEAREMGHEYKKEDGEGK